MSKKRAPKRCRECSPLVAPHPPGPRSLWTLEDAKAAESPKGYPRAEQYPPGVMPPTPLHAQTDAALMGVEAVRAVSRDKHEAASVEVAAGPHPRPPDHPIPANATRLLDLALAAGMTAHVIEIPNGYRVEGYNLNPGVGFRADYVNGLARTGATWHEKQRRWGMTRDERPDHDEKVERRVGGKVRLVPHPRRMPLGLDRHHLAQISGPEGAPVGVTEITNRLKAMA